LNDEANHALSPLVGHGGATTRRVGDNDIENDAK
jgi:hypothetical protein